MSSAEQIRNTIIDELMSIDDPDQLTNLKKIVSAKSNPTVKVTRHQQLALLKSEKDITEVRLYSNEEVEEDDSTWL